MSRFTKHKHLLILFFLISSISIWSTSCKKEESLDAIITVKLMSDTNIVVPGIMIEISQEEVLATGFTDSQGEYRQTFENPVILDIKAYNNSLTGNGKIYLSTRGETFRQTIFVYPIP